jgi:hypothetical protein
MRESVTPYVYHLNSLSSDRKKGKFQDFGLWMLNDNDECMLGPMYKFAPEIVAEELELYNEVLPDPDPVNEVPVKEEEPIPETENIDSDETTGEEKSRVDFEAIDEARQDFENSVQNMTDSYGKILNENMSKVTDGISDVIEGFEGYFGDKPDYGSKEVELTTKEGKSITESEGKQTSAHTAAKEATSENSQSKVDKDRDTTLNDAKQSAEVLPDKGVEQMGESRSQN